MKRPIAWHEECFVNLSRSRVEAKEAAERAQRAYEEMEARCRLLDLQISTAKAEGRGAFDADKFLKGRKS